MTSVVVTGVPSFVHSAGLRIAIGTRTLAVDIAFGGEFYAIADSEAIGIPIEMANAAALIRMGRQIKDAVDSAVQVRHPIDGTLKGIQGTIFTAAPRPEPTCEAPRYWKGRCCAGHPEPRAAPR